MKRLLLLCYAATAVFGAGSKTTPMIEIVSASDTSVTYRELQPTRVALDPAAGVFHYKGCPFINAKMQWTSPAAGTLHGLKPHACAKNAAPEYGTRTEKRVPRDPNHIAVLYLGNSLVYYNEVPAITSALGKHEKRPLRVDSVTRSGVTLQQLWDTTPALKKLWLEHWDYVVLQGGGGGVGPINRADEFNTYLAMFNEQVRKSGAEPLLYMVWRQRISPKHNDASIESAKKLKMRVAPVGLAWDDLVNTKRFERLDRDGVHPDARGAYLVAVTIYSTIYNKPAYGAPHDFAYLAASEEVYDDALREQTINDVQAKFIQDAAWRAVQKVR
jgi:hypothetical protein